VTEYNVPELTGARWRSGSHDEPGYTYHREPGLWPDCLVAHISGVIIQLCAILAGRLYIIGE
jgi:hypothetical protein